MSVAVTYAAVILKGLGTAVIAHFCSSVCRECGKNTLADYIELAGKLCIFTLCLPLISEITATATGLLGLC